MTREAQLAAPNRTANPLPEVCGTFRLAKLPVSLMKLPFVPVSKSCICLRGPSDWMHVENHPFDAPFTAGGDMAAVTWSNLMERLKRMGCGVNFKADA